MSVQFDANYYADSLVKFAIWSDLEPILGITNACLPVIRPVLKKISTSRRFTFGKKDKRSSMLRPRDERNLHTKSFRRLVNQAYPLAESHGTQTEITGPGSKNESIQDEFESQPTSELGMPMARIKVRSDWDVRSQV